MMNLSKTGIELVKEINNEWLAALEGEDPELRYLMYEPFTNGYWAEKYRIVWCNLEPGGEPKNKNEKILSLSSYGEWLKKSQAIKNTSLFIYCLYNKLAGIDIEEKQDKAARKDPALLLDYMKKVTYMNLLKDCGTTIFNRKYFWKFFSGEKGKKDKERTINIINALEPDIFVVTGEGKDLVQDLFNKDFDKNLSLVYNKTLFMSLGYPGRWLLNATPYDKNYIPFNVNMIYESLVKYNLLK
jgi:hypothetical protein